MKDEDDLELWKIVQKASRLMGRERWPKVVVRDVVAIPLELIKAQKFIELCMDTMFVNRMLYLTSISKRVVYRTA